MAQETSVPSQVEPYQKLQKCCLLNTQHYKVCIKVKVEQSKEKSHTPTYTPV